MKLEKEVQSVLDDLKKQGFEAYAVGGCVRDLLRGEKPKDWDVTTNALPQQIIQVFPESFYKNKFGTVTVKTDSQDKTLKEIEITTYRIDEEYSDKRHPDKVIFTKSLKEDLARRDFTINAMAMDEKEIIDPFEGQEDLEKKTIRAVGDANKRFTEDALRMLRAIRFNVELNFQIEPNTKKAISDNALLLRMIAKERIKDEFVRIIMSSQPDQGIELMRETMLLKYIIPELEQGVNVEQNRHHIYDIYQHSILALKYAGQQNFSLEVRLAALFHDIAKPQAKSGQGPDSTFYNHDMMGAKLSAQILERLRFPKQTIEKVAHLVRNHMFVYDVEQVTEAGVRRLLRRVGPENMQDLLNLREADRIGSGVPKAVPYKLRHLQYVIEKVSRDPISVKMLKINGEDIMELLNIKPGPKIGLILNALLSEALDDPKKNEKKYLERETVKLYKLTDKQLKDKDKKIKEKKEEVDSEIKKKYWVK